MSILTDLKDTFVRTGLMLRDLDKRINRLEMEAVINTATTIRSGRDQNGQYTIVEWKRADGTLAGKSTLSGLVSATGLYATRTMNFYKKNGTTLARQIVYTAVYDESTATVSETIVTDVTY